MSCSVCFIAKFKFFECSRIRSQALIVSQSYEEEPAYSLAGRLHLCLGKVGVFIQSDLYQAATLGILKSGRLKEVGRLIEVEYKINILIGTWKVAA